MKFYPHFYGEEENMAIKEKDTTKYTQEQLVDLWKTAFRNKKSFNLKQRIDEKSKLWARCSYCGDNIPRDMVLEAYSGKEKITLHPCYKDSLYTDWKGVVRSNLFEQSVEVYDEKGKCVLARESDRNHFFTSPIVRNRNVYTTFETSFRNHAAGNQKNYVRPEGKAFGIEIEVRFENTGEIPGFINKLLFSKWMKENYPDWVCERDGSLEGPGYHITGGLEMISPPSSAEVLYGQLAAILPKAKSLGAIGFKASTREVVYGIHITHNLYGPYSQNEGDRYCYLVNSALFRQFFAAASHRSTHPEFNRYSGFKDIPEVKGAMRSQMGDHYRATNPRGEGAAIETRIFRSNVNVSAVCSMIELVSLTDDFVKTNPPLDNPPAYAKFLKDNGSPRFKTWVKSWNGFDLLRARSNNEYID
jgi:hypothetical protein